MRRQTRQGACYSQLVLGDHEMFDLGTRLGHLGAGDVHLLIVPRRARQVERSEILTFVGHFGPLLKLLLALPVKGEQSKDGDVEVALVANVVGVQLEGLGLAGEEAELEGLLRPPHLLEDLGPAATAALHDHSTLQWKVLEDVEENVIVEITEAHRRQRRRATRDTSCHPAGAHLRRAGDFELSARSASLSAE